MLRKDAKVELISKVPLFAGCSKKDLREIAQLANEVNLGQGEVLCKQGGYGGEFFVLLEGSVDVARDGASIDTLRAGDFFGEIALITKTARNATVTAIEPLRALVITAQDFRDLLARSPKVFLKVFVVLAKRIPPDPI